MRKVLIALAAAGTALGVATPAAAEQFAPPPYGNAYGYNNYGQVRALQARIDRVQRLIERLDRRDVVRERGARGLRQEARDIERQLRRAARYGLNPYEANGIQRRVAMLEQRVRHVVANGRYGGYGYNGRDAAYGSYEHGGHYGDRDRDGRNDRWEDDHGRDHDRDHDRDGGYYDRDDD